MLLGEPLHITFSYDKKTLNIYHLFSLLYALILSPTFHFTPFSPPYCHFWPRIPCNTSDSSHSLISLLPSLA